jgi:IS1 family transposase
MESDSLKKLGIDFYILAEIDEQWSYIGKKDNQRWLWLVVDKKTGKIICFEFGKRDEAFKKNHRTKVRCISI